MSDNRTTELREKLTERGVKFATDDSAASKVTMWTTQNGGWMFDCDYMEPLNEKPGTIGAKTELMIYGYTPDQAIAATLGNSRVKPPCDGGYCPLCGAIERTCHIVKNSRKYVLSDGRELFDDGCSICNGYVGDGDNYCSNCGARVVSE